MKAGRVGWRQGDSVPDANHDSLSSMAKTRLASPEHADTPSPKALHGGCHIVCGSKIDE
uniref:Uncharacterized protein n=1 Tax=Ensifer adhaerens TaxID=106592 RepID=D1CSB3_ENSAD|nr:hypothetical protein Y4jP [Ensifer adhaerens]